MKQILEAIERSAIRIKHAIDVKDIGYSQEQNSSGETQLQLDIQSDLIIEDSRGLSECSPSKIFKLTSTKFKRLR